MAKIWFPFEPQALAGQIMTNTYKYTFARPIIITGAQNCGKNFQPKKYVISMSPHIFHVFSMFSHLFRPCHPYVIRLSSPRLRRQLVPSARFSVVELREAFGEVLAAREKRGRRLMAPGTENAGNSGGK